MLLSASNVVMTTQQVNGDYSDIRLPTESKLLDRSSPNFKGMITLGSCSTIPRVIAVGCTLCSYTYVNLRAAVTLFFQRILIVGVYLIGPQY